MRSKILHFGEESLKNIGTLLIFILILSESLLYSQVIDFHSEKIIMRISKKGILKLEGRYIFINPYNENVKVSIFYPFPVDSVHQYPKSIYVEGMPFKRIEKGISFEVKIQALKKKVVSVKYTQACLRKQARYILKTTNAWGKPLVRAEFVIILPAYFKKVDISYPPDSLKQINGEIKFFITKDNFMPEKDLEVFWE